MPKYFLIAILLILLSIFIFQFFFKKADFSNTVQINLNNNQYTLEIAKTMVQKSQGLSNRSSLCSNCGMIFIFNKEGIQPFWMKDTLIPLDMIWVNNQGQIVFIQTAQPEPNTHMTQLKIYQNTTPAKYVIEVNAGDAAKNNLKIGDFINIDQLND